MTIRMTERLTLRPLVPDDAEDYAAMRFHPEVMKWLPPARDADPLTAAHGTIDRFAAGWAEAMASAGDRLHDEAMQRSLSGNGRASFRRGRRLSAIRDYDSGLLMRLLRLHWPATYDRQGEQASTPRDVRVRFRQK